MSPTAPHRRGRTDQPLRKLPTPRYSDRMLQELWLKGPARPLIVPTVADLIEDDDDSRGIRCPLCAWVPRESDVWSCVGGDSPEHFTGGCGTVWHTFDTGGVCPGCAHQWEWTSCLRCHGWSRHKEWYGEE